MSTRSEGNGGANIQNPTTSLVGPETNEQQYASRIRNRLSEGLTRREESTTETEGVALHPVFRINATGKNVCGRCKDWESGLRLGTPIWMS